MGECREDNGSREDQPEKGSVNNHDSNYLGNKLPKEDKQSENIEVREGGSDSNNRFQQELHLQLRK